MNVWKEWGIGAGVVLFLMSCSEKTPDTSTGPEYTSDIFPARSSSEVVPSGTIRFQVSFSAGNGIRAKLAETQTIDRVTTFIYDRGEMEVKQADLTIADGVASGRVAVPAQDDLRVVLAYFDGSIVRYLGEDGDVDVPIGGETTAEIVAHYLGISLQAPEVVGIGNTYTLRWPRVAQATGYQLEEATQSDFGDASQVYKGSEVRKTLSAKNAEGTFDYRARVETAYGVGPWHSTGSVMVRFEVGEGTIRIDTPIPPDEPAQGSVATKEITVDLPGGATMEFVWIEPGTFMMGSPELEEERGHDEGPQHEVTISQGFYLGKYEVTQGQWEAVMGNRQWEGKDHVQLGNRNPAVSISWGDVLHYIVKLNEHEGVSVYRMPTEAEWEYACRAGTETRWSFGDYESQLGEYAWYSDNAWNAGEQYAHVVGTKKPNPWGLYDMHGNVLEWCQDWYGDYSSSAQTDPTGASTSSHRVTRGGFFGSDGRSVRSAIRNDDSPGYRHDDTGFRLLRTK